MLNASHRFQGTIPHTRHTWICKTVRASDAQPKNENRVDMKIWMVIMCENRIKAFLTTPLSICYWFYVCNILWNQIDPATGPTITIFMDAEIFSSCSFVALELAFKILWLHVKLTVRVRAVHEKCKFGFSFAQWNGRQLPHYSYHHLNINLWIIWVRNVVAHSCMSEIYSSMRHHHPNLRYSLSNSTRPFVAAKKKRKRSIRLAKYLEKKA